MNIVRTKNREQLDSATIILITAESGEHSFYISFSVPPFYTSAELTTSIGPAHGLTMSKSSLSSVVSNLVRASMGSSVSDSVADEDLDRHVAELILKEAKQKGERYSTYGIRAYLSNGM